MPILISHQQQLLEFQALLFDLAGTLSLKISGEFDPIQGTCDLVRTANSLEIPQALVTTSNRILLRTNLVAIALSDFFPDELCVADAAKTSGQGFLDGLVALNQRFSADFKPGDVLLFEDDPVYAQAAFNAGFLVCWIGLSSEDLPVRDPRFIRVGLLELTNLRIQK